METKRPAGAAAARALFSVPMISSHGRAMAMLPAPRRTALRFKRKLGIATDSLRAAGVVEEFVGLGQREQELLHVVARLLERDLGGRRGAIVGRSQRLAVSVFQPVVGEAELRVAGCRELLHQRHAVLHRLA